MPHRDASGQRRSRPPVERNGRPTGPSAPAGSEERGPEREGAGSAAKTPALLEALDGRRPARTPVWFMRQAGRSLPEYRRLRAQAGLPMLDACLDPALAAQITVQPVRRHGVDAAIFFSDIVVPLRLAGVGVRIDEGIGPVVDEPVRSRADVARLVAHGLGDGGRGAGGPGLDGADGLASVEKGVGLAVAELGSPGKPGVHAGLGKRARAGLAHSADTAGWTPLVGFGAGPFTLAAYLAEGRPSRDHLAARSLMHADPESWDRLLTWCAHLTGSFIAAQVRAGASAAQLFDSWAGALSRTVYRERVRPYSALALDVAGRALSPTTGRKAPLIHFGTGTARLLREMRAAGADAIGVDERMELDDAIRVVGAAEPDGLSCPVQGNLDPALLAAPWPVLRAGVDACMEAGRVAPGHVVNLGHGVPAAADPDVLTRIVARVHGSPEWEAVALAGWDPDVETSEAAASAGRIPQGVDPSTVGAGIPARPGQRGNTGGRGRGKANGEDEANGEDGGGAHG